MSRHIGIGLLLLTITGCLDVIEIDNPDRPATGIVIQGRLIQGDPSRVQVSIGELYAYDTNLPRPIAGAAVVLTDAQGREVRLDEDYQGNYEATIAAGDPDFPVVVGGNYRLSVQLGDGREYESAWEPLPAVPPIEAVEVRHTERTILADDGGLITEPWLEMSVRTSLREPASGNPARLLWQMRDAFRLTDGNAPDVQGKTCYVQWVANSEKVTVFNGATAASPQLDRHAVYTTPRNYRFAERYILVLLQQSLSETAYRYWEEVSRLQARTGSIYDAPPARVRTNFSEVNGADGEVHGFFYATQQDTFYRLIEPAEAGSPRRYCPLPPVMAPPPSYPTPCDDCLVVTNSSLEPPDFW